MADVSFTTDPVASTISTTDDVARVSNEYSTNFDGINDYIDCGSDSSLDDIWSGGGTVSVWFKCNTASSNRAFCNQAGNGNQGWWVGLENYSTGTPGHSLQFIAVHTGTNLIYTTRYEFPINIWHHITVSYNSDSILNIPKLYKNGVELEMSAIIDPVGEYKPAHASNFEIGRKNTVGHHKFRGNISGISLFNSILDIKEIKYIYDNKGRLNLIDNSVSPYKSSSSLVAWWRMGDRDTAPTITDNSFNTNNGTMTLMSPSFSDDTPSFTPFSYTNDTIASASFSETASLSNTTWKDDGKPTNTYIQTYTDTNLEGISYHTSLIGGAATSRERAVSMWVFLREDQLSDEDVSLFEWRPANAANAANTTRTGLISTGALGTGTMRFRCVGSTGTGGRQGSGIITLNIRQWYHIVLRMAADGLGTEFTVTVNNVAIINETLMTSINTSSKLFSICHRLNAYVDEVAIWKNPISVASINQIYTTYGNPTTHPNQPDLLTKTGDLAILDYTQSQVDDLVDYWKMGNEEYDVIFPDGNSSSSSTQIKDGHYVVDNKSSTSRDLAGNSYAYDRYPIIRRTTGFPEKQADKVFTEDLESENVNFTGHSYNSNVSITGDSSLSLASYSTDVPDGEIPSWLVSGEELLEHNNFGENVYFTKNNSSTGYHQYHYNEDNDYCYGLTGNQKINTIISHYSDGSGDVSFPLDPDFPNSSYDNIFKYSGYRIKMTISGSNEKGYVQLAINFSGTSFRQLWQVPNTIDNSYEVDISTSSSSQNNGALFLRTGGSPKFQGTISNISIQRKYWLASHPAYSYYDPHPWLQFVPYSIDNTTLMRVRITVPVEGSVFDNLNTGGSNNYGSFFQMVKGQKLGIGLTYRLKFDAIGFYSSSQADLIAGDDIFESVDNYATSNPPRMIIRLNTGTNMAYGDMFDGAFDYLSLTTDLKTYILYFTVPESWTSGNPDRLHFGIKPGINGSVDFAFGNVSLKEIGYKGDSVGATPTWTSLPYINSDYSYGRDLLTSGGASSSSEPYANLVSEVDKGDELYININVAGSDNAGKVYMQVLEDVHVPVLTDQNSAIGDSFIGEIDFTKYNSPYPPAAGNMWYTSNASYQIVSSTKNTVTLGQHDSIQSVWGHLAADEDPKYFRLKVSGSVEAGKEFGFKEWGGQTTYISVKTSNGVVDGDNNFNIDIAVQANYGGFMISRSQVGEGTITINEFSFVEHTQHNLLELQDLAEGEQFTFKKEAPANGELWIKFEGGFSGVFHYSIYKVNTYWSLDYTTLPSYKVVKLEGVDGDASSGYLSLAANPITFSGEFTYSFWYKLADGIGSGRPLGNISDLNGVKVLNSGGYQEIRFRLANKSVNNQANQEKIQIGQWHHVMITRDSSNFVRIWVDKKELALYDSQMLGYFKGGIKIEGDSTIKYIGQEITGYFFNGLIDNVAMWSSKLDEKLVPVIYNRIDLNTDVGDYRGSSSLVGWWKADNANIVADDNWSITDKGSNNNNAVAVNLNSSALIDSTDFS